MDPWRYQVWNSHKLGDQPDTSYYYAVRLPDGIGPNFIMAFGYQNQEGEPVDTTIMVTGVTRFLELKTFFQDNRYKLINIYFLGTETGVDLRNV